jgi:hypothetical protein
MKRLVFAVLLTTGPAFAHSWYPFECCSERDCFPVATSDVKVIKGGWQLHDGTIIEHIEARPSPDGRFHVCRRDDGKGALIRMHRKPACFWAPIGAS